MQAVKPKRTITQAPKRRGFGGALIGIGLLFWSGIGYATIPLEAVLLAERACPALASIKRGSNPGKQTLAPGEHYRVVGKNRDEASHYLIQLDGTPPAQRWVAVTCGRVEGKAPASAPALENAGKSQPPAAAAAPQRPPQQLILAASWQNAFCTFSSRSPECRALDPDDAAAERFSLHGLWPQPMANSYCGVSNRDRADSKDGDWRDLPRLDLTADTRARLTELMPGIRSHLQRHEWTKHGTCYGTDADTYFDDSLDLMEQLNASSVRALFANNRGNRLRASEVRDAFNRAFGRGTGDRLRLICRDGLITELRISLRGAPGTPADLRDWLSAAPSKSGGCRGGRVQ